MTKDSRTEVGAAEGVHCSEGSAEAAVRRVRSDKLLGPGGVLIIEHAGREYRLRQTSTGKLILTA
ncbi:MAG TPA: hemin uptake protein HemP [Burkholderiales bacterium]